MVRGDRAALVTSFLRTWTAFLTRCCSRVVFGPPVLPFVRCACNHCQTLPQHQHRSTIFKHSRPRHSFRLERLFCICASADQPKVFQCHASIRVLHSCVNMSSGARHSWEAADVHMQSSGAVPELDEHDETWWADDVVDSDPKLTKHFLIACWTSPTSQRFLTQRRLRFVLVCIESWDVRRCETHWVPP